MTTPGQRNPISRFGWLILGLTSSAIGAIGIAVPGLPTTVFFIVAAAAFSRSSPRLEAWVLGLPAIGPAVSDYRAGLGMPKRAKQVALTMLSVAVVSSALVLNSWWVRLIVIGAGIIGVAFILRVPTKP